MSDSASTTACAGEQGCSSTVLLQVKQDNGSPAFRNSISKAKKVAHAKHLKDAPGGPQHPKYSVMIADAITHLKERGGSSRQAIIKYIFGKYKLGNQTNKINARVKVALKAGVKIGTLKQSKGTGASGSFRLGEKLKRRMKSDSKSSSGKPKTASKPRSKITKVKMPSSSTGKTKIAKSTKKAQTDKKSTKKVTTAKSAKTPKKTAANAKSSKSSKNANQKCMKAEASKSRQNATAVSKKSRSSTPKKSPSNKAAAKSKTPAQKAIKK